MGALVGALLVLDQFSKFWIQGNVRPHSSVEIIPGILNLAHYANRGAIGGYGWQSPLTIPLLATGSVLLAGLIVVLYHYYCKLKPPSWRVRLFAALALTPLIAHTLDRLRQGYVVDFMQIGELPVFNFADVLPHLAIIVLALEFAALIQARRRRSPRSAPEAELG